MSEEIEQAYKEWRSAMDAVAATAEGDSNDAEIDAQQRALSHADSLIEMFRKGTYFTADDVSDTVNAACDDIKDAADIYEGPVDDALNLLVNVSLTYLRSEAESVGEAIVANYEGADLDCPDECDGVDCNHDEDEDRDDRLVDMVLGWLNRN